MNTREFNFRAKGGRTAVLAGAAIAAAAIVVPVVGLAGTASAATSLHFQFGPTKTPLASGYAHDTGAAYSKAGHGWQTAGGTPIDMSWATDLRSSGTTVQRGTIQASKRRVGVNWNSAIANGTYTVTVGVGDAAYTDSVDTVLANGTTVISGFKPTASKHFSTGKATVKVTNGHLLLSTAKGKNVKLNFVDIVPATTASVPPPTPVVDTTSPTHLAWFYNEPALSSDLNTVVKKFSTFFISASAQPFADKVEAGNPTADILQYFLLDQIIKPAAGKNELHNNAAYVKGDFANIWKNHQDWFLKNSAGVPSYESNGYYRMDPASAGWRAFWVARVKAANVGWTGVFADNTDASMCGMDKAGRKIPKYKDATYTDAIAGFLKYAYTNYFHPSGKQLTLNVVNACTGGRDYSSKYTPNSTGVFIEGWGVDWHTGYLPIGQWEKQLKNIENLVAAGKRAVVVAQGAQLDYARQQFAFSSYLLVQSAKVAFRYSLYGVNGYNYAWMYSNYSAKLGTAKGARYLVSGTTYRRNYTNGYVTVNPTTHSSQIVVNS